MAINNCASVNPSSPTKRDIVPCSLNLRSFSGSEKWQVSCNYIGGLGKTSKMEKAIGSRLSSERADLEMEETKGCLTTMVFRNAVKKGC